MNFMFRLYIEYIFILGVAPPNSNEREMNEVEIDSEREKMMMIWIGLVMNESKSNETSTTIDDNNRGKYQMHNMPTAGR